MTCFACSLVACTPTDHNPQSPEDIVATGDDSSVRPDNDKDD